MSCCVWRHLLTGGTSSSGTCHDSWPSCGFHWGGGRQSGRCTRVWIKALTQVMAQSPGHFCLFGCFDDHNSKKKKKKTLVTLWIFSSCLEMLGQFCFIGCEGRTMAKQWVDDDCNFYVWFVFWSVYKCYFLSSITTILKRKSIQLKDVLQCGGKQGKTTFAVFTLRSGRIDLPEHSGHQESQQDNIWIF